MPSSPKFLAGGRQGSQLLWIAPSGGRDRPNAEGVWMPSPFDASSVELMRQLLGQVGEFFNPVFPKAPYNPLPATLALPLNRVRGL